jgi:DNA invertase Pin-like site-specific DNA recombinase
LRSKHEADVLVKDLSRGTHHCINERLRNHFSLTKAQMFQLCVNLLQNVFEWQQVYATIPMLIGYARVSRQDGQETTIQIQALKAAGADRVFEEKASGGRWERPQLHRALDQLRPGDVFVVWKLDRLSRSLKDLLTLMEKIDAVGAGFRSLTEAIDTTTPAGRMMMQMVGSFAEFERAMIRERTKAGLDAARQQGRIGGRRPKLTPHQQQEIVDMVTSERRSSSEAARLFNVHPATVSRLLSKNRLPEASGDSVNEG